jgi:3-oxoacyl-[acyl-carrier-protein] synthase III
MKILATGSAVPERVVTNDDLPRFWILPTSGSVRARASASGVWRIVRWNIWRRRRRKTRLKRRGFRPGSWT